MARPFKIDGALLAPNLKDVPARAKQLEEVGYDGTFTFEGPHEPFMPLVLAAEHSGLDVATGVAIAFARTPMTAANLAWDLANYSGGRFTLGLGSQIKPHIEARYSMPWGKPVTRMREFVQAYKAIFDCWLSGEKLDFRGEYYTHTLMPPMFVPGKLPSGRPPITLGGVGPKMTACAGEVADGHLAHPFNTRKSIETVTIPNLKVGLDKAGRTLDDFTLSIQTIVVTGQNEAAYEGARVAARNQIAFYGSTPAYRGVLDAHGWGELQPQLREMTKTGRWGDMAGLITDEILETIAVCGEPKQVAKKLVDKYGDYADRVAFASPFPLDPVCEAEILSALDG